ncbi:hypothetical protein OAO01_00100 [Oligoflexia bacterium]|nr:hypothetical protein [Oligoflexia bacterium]
MHLKPRLHNFDKVLQEKSYMTTSARLKVFIALVATGVYALVVFYSAWICDDAYITLRAVDNFIHGFGLRWNVAERVQVFTHPLWALLLSPFYYFTQEPYYTTLALSFVFCVSAVWVFVQRFGRSSFIATAGVLVLTSSKAFVDYSTSGLENALSFFLIALFYYCYLRREKSGRALQKLAVLSALIALNRMDLMLLTLPALIAEWKRGALGAGTKTVLLGFTPFFLWEAFSVFYYGSFFPNTAYAKLSTDIDRSFFIQQGLTYFVESFVRDPITLCAIVAGIVAPFLFRVRIYPALAGGIILYLLYIVWIGGDFMTGRFFSVPLLASLFLLVHSGMQASSLKQSISALMIVAACISVPGHQILSNGSYGSDPTSWIGTAHIADERAFYYKATGLLNMLADTSIEDSASAREGVAAKNNLRTCVRDGVGIFGFYAGPTVHIVDIFGLADPLLPHLPINPAWDVRIGHLIRVVPDGYFETLETGTNKIRVRGVSEYYQKVQLITRADLFNLQRLKAVWDLQIGAYASLLNFARILAHEKLVQVPRAQLDTIRNDGTPWNALGNVTFSYGGVEIDLGERYFPHTFEISLDRNDAYIIGFMQAGQFVFYDRVDPVSALAAGLKRHILELPEALAKKKFEKIRILPIGGDNKYSLGHLLLR